MNLNREKLTKEIKSELHKIVSQVKTTQGKLQKALESKTWMDEAKKLADRRKKEFQKLITTDVEKVKTFIEAERKELERLQKQLPTEVTRFKKFFNNQKKELKALLVAVNRKPARKTASKKRTTQAETGSKTKKAAASKKKTAAPTETTTSAT